MNYAGLEHFISSSRAQRYLIAAGNDGQRAVALYQHNLRLAQAFHPLLGLIEVVVRNLISAKLEHYFGDKDWIINQKSKFMSDPSLTYTNKRTGKRETNTYLKTEVKKAENRLAKAGAAVTSGRIIAEQTFGFWTDLFEVHHYRLLGGRPVQIFTALPSTFGRKEILQELHGIRRFRNRINHNEPICFHQNKIDFSGVQAVHHAINSVFSWIDPRVRQFSNELDEVGSVISAGQLL